MSSAMLAAEMVALGMMEEPEGYAVYHAATLTTWAKRNGRRSQTNPSGRSLAALCHEAARSEHLTGKPLRTGCAKRIVGGKI